jgi:hypothetical protein
MRLSSMVQHLAMLGEPLD